MRRKEDQRRLLDEGLDTRLLDYADAHNVEQLAAAVLSDMGGALYAVFHNGAYGQPGAVEDLSRACIETQFATNVFGWIQLTNLLIPSMRANGRGRIIFNSSVLGLIALRYRGAYNASKYAIEGFADTLRLELKNTPIGVSLIEPGPIESRFRENSLRMFEQFIEVDTSCHASSYRGQIKRLKQEGNAAPFTLPAEAVAKKVSVVLSVKKPSAHYYVTFPTYLFGYLKRLLPTRVLDKILVKV